MHRKGRATPPASGIPQLSRADAGRLAVNGLSGGQVSARRRAGLINRLPQDSSRSLARILRDNVLTLFNSLVLGCFLLLLLLGEWKDALFGFAALANTVIGVVQEYRAKLSLDRLALLQAPRARVLREGKVAEIAIDEVVSDDVLVLHPGDQVTADARVLGCAGLEVDESLLTGEAAPVAKAVGEEVLSGSTVVAGRANARVIRVGADSFASQLTVEAKRFSLVNSELRDSINRILRWVSVALIPIMIVVLNGQMQAAGGWSESFRTGAWEGAAVGAVASLISMIPLGLILMTSVAFAVGAVSLARNKVLVQELAAVEGLARVDILCLDKTGTLTEGRIIFDAAHPVTGPAEPGWEEALAWFGADEAANATARCLTAAFPNTAALRPVSSVPFSSARKWSAASFHAVAPGAWVLGAPELVLAPDSPADRDALVAAAAMASDGLRTLLLAHADRPMTQQDATAETLPAGLRAVALLTFREQVRPDAAATLAYFKDEGVDLRIFSGDDPRTVAAVARRVGLDVDGDGWDARKLPVDPDQLSAVLEDNRVFGRVTPAQKKDMVLALQRRGHVVAMTGDGVNDALALKTADIGIAMGSGAAATRAVSRMVLLDGEFARLPKVVAEGRRVIANIERVSMLFLTKTSYAMALGVSFGALLWSYPFLPRQLSVLDGITIGIPAFFLALMPNPRRYLRGFLRRALSFAVPAGLVVALVLISLNLVILRRGGYSTEEAWTLSVTVLALVGLWVLVVLARPLNWLRAALVAVMYLTLAATLTVPAMLDFLNLIPMRNDLLFLSLAVAVPGCLGIELIHHRLRNHRSAGARNAPPAAFGKSSGNNRRARV